MTNPHSGNGGQHNHTNIVEHFSSCGAISISLKNTESILIDPITFASCLLVLRHYRRTPVMQTLLTPKQFLQRLEGKIGRDSLYRLLESGRIKSVRLKKRYKIPESELQDFFTRELEDKK
jgi:excisionase family DNA binding protein